MIPASIADAFARNVHGELDLAAILGRDDTDAYELLCREYSYLRRRHGNGEVWKVELSTLPFLCGKEVSLFDDKSWKPVGDENSLGLGATLKESTQAHVFGQDLDVERVWRIEECSTLKP